MAHHSTSGSRKSRTTICLPTHSLRQAKRIAHARGTSLSAVIGEAMAEGLRAADEAARSTDVLDRYRQAFVGFSDEEIAILNGIILEPRARI